jgi:EAL domain-containing protein (putative c-di-GMP-specific phosphodiesterase class I)
MHATQDGLRRVYVKVDRSFVLNMLKNSSDEAIVRSTIELAHSLGLKAIAEGVEDEATLDRLRELGCDQAQGYHVGRPMPLSQLIEWLATSPWGAKLPEERRAKA